MIAILALIKKHRGSVQDIYPEGQKTRNPTSETEVANQDSD